MVTQFELESQRWKILLRDLQSMAHSNTPRISKMCKDK